MRRNKRGIFVNLKIKVKTYPDFMFLLLLFAKRKEKKQEPK